MAECSRRSGFRSRRGCTRAPTLLGLGALLTLQAGSHLRCFALTGSRRPGQAGQRRRVRIARQDGSLVATSLDTLGTPPENMAAFQPSQLSLGISFALFVIGLGGVPGTIQRTGQPKFVEKTYVMPGDAAGGLQMRSIAGGVAAYFRSLNYVMEDSPQKGKIRFVGQMQGNLGQALYLTGLLAGTIFATGILLVSVLPDGPFGIGPDWWFSPMVLSPWAGWYYWQRAFRKDIVELQLQTTDDCTETTLIALGSEDTIEELQSGVRFQSDAGKLFRLMEPGKEYQPGIFETLEGKQIVKDEARKDEVASAPVSETA